MGDHADRGICLGVMALDCEAQSFEKPSFHRAVQRRLHRAGDVQVLELKSWIQRRLGDFDGLIDSRRQARTVNRRAILTRQTG